MWGALQKLHMYFQQKVLAHLIVYDLENWMNPWQTVLLSYESFQVLGLTVL